jgi:hypothetical protein
VKNALKYDDSLDVFGVHCIGGIVGALGTGILADPALGGQGWFDYTVFPPLPGEYDMAGQVLTQFKAVLTTLLWSGIGSAVLFALLKYTLGLRPSEAPSSKGSTSASTASAPTTTETSLAGRGPLPRPRPASRRSSCERTLRPEHSLRPHFCRAQACQQRRTPHSVAFTQQKDAKCTCPLAFLSSRRLALERNTVESLHVRTVRVGRAAEEDSTPEFSCQQIELELQGGRAGSKGNPI